MITTNFTTGNFDLVIKGELNPDQQAKAHDAAVRYIVQRDGATKTYLALKGVENDKGKKSLPAGFEREDLEFSPENLDAMCAAMSEALKPYGEFSVSGSEHVKGAATAMTRATQFVDSLLGTDGETAFRQLIGVLGGDSKADRDELIKFAHEKGLGKSK